MVPVNFWPAPEAFLDFTIALQVTDYRARCTGVAVCDESGQPLQQFCQGQAAHFYYEFEILEPLGIPIGGLEFYDRPDHIVHGKNSLQFNAPLPPPTRKGMRLRYHQVIHLEVSPGAYQFTVGLASTDEATYTGYCAGALTHNDLRGHIQEHCRVMHLGPFTVGLQPTGKLLHHGVANLPGRSDLSVSEASQVTLPSAKPDQATKSAGARLVYIASYPRSGNTWARNLIQYYFDRYVSSLYEEAGTVNLEQNPDESYRPMFVDYRAEHPPYLVHPAVVNDCGRFLSENFRNHLTRLNEHFFIKTHELPYDRYFDREAVIYMVRHPAAVVWSYYNFLRDFGGAQAVHLTLEQVIRGEVVFGSWTTSVERWLECGQALGNRFTFIQYEQLLVDQMEFCRIVSRLTGLPIRQVKNEFPGFDFWSRQAPQLYRSGRIDEWREHFSDAHLQLMRQIHGPTMAKLGYSLE